MPDLPFIARARSFADRTAFRTPEASHTYQQLLDRSAEIASAVLGDQNDLQEARVALLVSQAQQRFGNAGLLAGTGLTAFADAHAPIASLLSLFAAARIDADMLRTGVFVALVANTSTRLVTAWVSGGLAYALRVGSALLAGLLAALAAGVLAA